MFGSAFFLHPPRSYLSARSVNTGERQRRKWKKMEKKSAPQKEKNELTLADLLRNEGATSTRQERLMWEAAVAPVHAEVRHAWAAEQQPKSRWHEELASRKRGLSKSRWNPVWGVWRDVRMAFWKIRCNFTPPASRLVKKAVGYN